MKTRRVRRELGAVVPAAAAAAATAEEVVVVVPPTREALGGDSGGIKSSSSSYHTATTTSSPRTPTFDLRLALATPPEAPSSAGVCMEELCAKLEEIATRNAALHARCLTRAAARRSAPPAAPPPASDGACACK